RVRVVDHHGHLAPGLHVAVEPQQVAGVELVERGRTRGVEHRDEPLRPVRSLGAGDDTARLVGMVPAGVGDDLVHEIASDHQHTPSLRPSRGRAHIPGRGSPLCQPRGVPAPRLEITYCTRCRWLLRAGWTAQELLTTFPADLGEVALVPGTGGVFQVRL